MQKNLVNNAIILAAGLSSRFGGTPKGLAKCCGEILVERLIRQLNEAGIYDIILVVGHKKELFEYLGDRVKIIENNKFATDNNLSSILSARNYLGNSYVCPSDVYFIYNPFNSSEEESYYAVSYKIGSTKEWCIKGKKYIEEVSIGGSDSFVLLGHSFWDEKFSKKFLELADKEYNRSWMWEDLYIRHLDILKMRPKICKFIYEFDTKDELEDFEKWNTL